MKAALILMKNSHFDRTLRYIFPRNFYTLREKNGKFVCQNLKFTEIQNHWLISLTVSALRHTVVMKSVVVGGCPASFD